MKKTIRNYKGYSFEITRTGSQLSIKPLYSGQVTLEDVLGTKTFKAVSTETGTWKIYRFGFDSITLETTNLNVILRKLRRLNSALEAPGEGNAA